MPYRSHKTTVIFQKEKSLSKQKRLRKILLFCGENFYTGGMRVFSKAHFEAFSYPSGPESRPIHSFSIILVPTEHIFWIFWNRLQVHNINIFIQIIKFSCFWTLNVGGVTEEIQLFVKKWNFSQSNIAWGKKTNKKQKSFYTWQTKLKPKKTEIFLLLIASVRRVNEKKLFWKSKLPLKETRFGRKNPEILIFFQKSCKKDKKFHFLTAQKLF